MLLKVAHSCCCPQLHRNYYITGEVRIKMKEVLCLIFCSAIVQGLPQYAPHEQESCESKKESTRTDIQVNTGSNLPYEVGVKPKIATCAACELGVNLIKYYALSGKPRDEIFSIFKDICKGTRYRPPEICDDLIELIGDELLIIMREATNTPLEICSFFEPGSCGSGDVPGHRWTVELPSIPKPPIGSIEPPDPNTPKFKVLHISDTHYDPEFLEGTVDNCNLDLCCRIENGIAQANESAAGKWGGWKCDIPEITLDSMLEHAKATHSDLSYIVWTGDLPPHNTWSQTKEESLFLLNSTVSKVKQYFPNTPVFPALGNHEPSPPHNFPPPIINRQEFIQWYYDELVKQWSKFLPESTFDTIRAGGYYIAEVRPGFKIISLNTNYCYFNNWWLILNSTDPGDMLKWFVEELQKAENNDEVVHVIAHIPPGYYDCLKVFAENYYRIIDRYEKTITAQFFGHTHTDEIELYYDTGDYNKTRPVAVGYVAPAVTTHVNLNPGYRVYSVDGDGTRRYVENFETWVMNLTKTNEEDNPDWYKLFSAKESYNLANLLPEEWNNFYERLKTDDQLLDTYDRNYWKDSPKRGECGDGCRRTRLCDIRSCVLYGEPNY